MTGIGQIVLSESVCLDVVVDINNTSAGFDSLRWDFCHEDLASVGGFSSTINIPEIRTYTTTTVRDEDTWYQFVSARNSNIIYRISYGTSLSNVPTVVDFFDATTPGNLSTPRKMVFWYESNNWYALVANLGSQSITRLDFGTSLVNMPTSTDLGNLSSWNQLHGLDIVEDNGDIIVITSSLGADKLTLLNFGNSILNTPSGGDILDIGVAEALIDDPMGVRLINTPEGWYGFVASNVAGEIVRMEFGSNLMSEPTFSSEYTLSGATDVEVIREGLSYHVFAANEDSDLANIEYQSNFSSIPSVELTTTNNRNFNFEVVREEPSWHAFTSNWASRIVLRHSFSNTCTVNTANIETSTELEPQLSYSTSGTYVAELTNFTDGFTENYVDTVVVLNETPPNISFTIDDSRCLTVQNDFTSTGSMDIISYAWDFGDGSPIETNPSPSHTFASAGTYTVRLNVNNANCDNFYEETITIYPNLPVPSFSVVSEECVNTNITFTNTTDESQHAGVLLYLWDFDSDGTIDSTDPNPTFAYSTPGTKTVSLYDSIPGCINGPTTFDIDVSNGPTSNFLASTLSICQGETITFTDNSSMDVVDYFWDFQNGITSTVANPPDQLFQNEGFYDVSLTTTDAQGCQDTYTVEIAVAAEPVIDLSYDIPCTSVDGTSFYDLSTVNGADIVSWRWEVDGQEVSTEQNPVINFSTTGNKTIGLSVQSSNGCQSDTTFLLVVASAPNADFFIQLGCQGEESMFVDNTESTGNPIVSWLWTVDGEVYTTQDIEHVFANAGTFEVTLEVTGQNFCAESITKIVEVDPLPLVDFTVVGECSNQIIEAQDQTPMSADPVVSRQWRLDGDPVGNGTDLFLEGLQEGTYTLSLELETAEGCVVSTNQLLEINSAPEASFASSRSFGLPGDRLTFTNTSSGAVSFQWLLDGNVLSVSDTEESIAFLEEGQFEVSLVAQNSLGCYDTISQEITIAVPVVDLSIGSFELVRENTTGKIFMEVVNSSNLPIEVTDVQIELENQFSVTEQILQFIDAGEASLVSLNVGIPLEIAEPAYFCVTLTSQYADYPDINPIDNEKCLTLQPLVQVENPFPNPTSDELRVKVIVPEDGRANVQLLAATGQVHIKEEMEISAGLTNLFFDLSDLDPGIYFVVVDVIGFEFRKKVVKR